MRRWQADDQTSTLQRRGAGGWRGYNALTLLLADGTTTVEYVHIRAGSMRVAVGDTVARGQVQRDCALLAFTVLGLRLA